MSPRVWKTKDELKAIYPPGKASFTISLDEFNSMTHAPGGFVDLVLVRARMYGFGVTSHSKMVITIHNGQVKIEFPPEPTAGSNSMAGAHKAEIDKLIIQVCDEMSCLGGEPEVKKDYVPMDDAFVFTITDITGRLPSKGLRVARENYL